MFLKFRLDTKSLFRFFDKHVDLVILYVKRTRSAIIYKLLLFVSIVCARAFFRDIFNRGRHFSHSNMFKKHNFSYLVRAIVRNAY